MDVANNKSLQFAALDTLRGVAAIAVAIFHFLPNWAGYLAVDFFLVLSGFILSHSYLYKSKTTMPVAFISHRIARLYPLHIFTLLTFALAYFLTEGKLPSFDGGAAFTLAQHVTLTQNIGLTPSGLTWNYPSWSIAVEFWVNILFIYYVTQATRSGTLFLVSLLGFLLVFTQVGHFDVQSANIFGFLNTGMLRGLSSFLLGILAYRAYLHYRDDVRIGKYLNYLEWLCVLAVVGVIAGRENYTSGMDFFAPYIFLVTIAVFSLEGGYLSALLKRVHLFGVISYSLYLNQITVLLAVRYVAARYGFDPIAVEVELIYLAVLVVYSYMTYRLIEQPLRKKGRDLLARMVVSVTPARPTP